jgi:glutathione synthase
LEQELKIVFIVNNPKTQKPTYTTAHIALAAVKRGHEVYLVAAGDLTINKGLVLGACVKAKDMPTMLDFVNELRGTMTRTQVISGSDFVFLRNNPSEGTTSPLRGSPALDFGRLLEQQKSRVINSPDGLARAQSKLYLTRLPPEILPKTLVSRDPKEIKHFLQSLAGPGILKPINGFGGENVFYMRRKQVINLNQTIDVVCREGFAMVQEFLPEAKDGDKRLLLLNGQPIRWGDAPDQVAMYRRMRPKGDFRNNIHIGGHRRRALFTQAEQNIVDTLRPTLLQDGLSFVGVDIVGTKLLEVNVFAPGGIHNINELCRVDVADLMLATLEGSLLQPTTQP